MANKTTWMRRMMLRYRRRFFDLAYALPYRGGSLFNLGVTPVPDHVCVDPSGRIEPYQIALYDLAADHIAPILEPGDRMVEISAGKGAGAAYLKRRLGVPVMAFEPSFTGRFWARVLFGVRVHYALAEEMPVANGTAAAILSIESAHQYMTPTFAAEAFRILRPGGVLVIGDFPLMPPGEQARRVPDWLCPAGFEIADYDDLTHRVLKACVADADRKRRMFRWLPPRIRREAESAFSVEPSPRIDSFRDGLRGYYLVAARKPRQRCEVTES